MEDFTLAQVADLAGQIALSVTLLYLLITEKKEHQQTRKLYHDDMMRLIDEMQDLLKEVAGIKANMWSVQRIARGDTRPLPEVDH